MEALSQGQSVDEFIPDPEQVITEDDGGWGALEALLAGAGAAPTPTPAVTGSATSNGTGRAPHVSLYRSDLEYLEEALREAFTDPHTRIGWTNYAPDSAIAEFSITEEIRDLRRRLEHLPQDYVAERRVFEQLKLATSKEQGRQQLTHARNRDDITWPAAHYLGPLHPVIDWAADRALAEMSRNEVLALSADVTQPTFLMLGTVSNRRGHLLSRVFMAVDPIFVRPLDHLGEWLDDVGLSGRLRNPGTVTTTGLQDQLGPAVTKAQTHLDSTSTAVRQQTEQLLESWLSRARSWEQDADALISRAELRTRRLRIQEERRLAEDLRPAQNLVRPLLALVPQQAAQEGAA